MMLDNNTSAQENTTACYAMEVLLTNHPQARVALFCVLLGSLILGIPLAWNVLWHLKASCSMQSLFSKKIHFDNKITILSCR